MKMSTSRAGETGRLDETIPAIPPTLYLQKGPSNIGQLGPAQYTPEDFQTSTSIAQTTDCVGAATSAVKSHIDVSLRHASSREPKKNVSKDTFHFLLLVRPVPIIS